MINKGHFFAINWELDYLELECQGCGDIVRISKSYYPLEYAICRIPKGIEIAECHKPLHFTSRQVENSPTAHAMRY